MKGIFFELVKTFIQEIGDFVRFIVFKKFFHLDNLFSFPFQHILHHLKPLSLGIQQSYLLRNLTIHITPTLIWQPN